MNDVHFRFILCQVRHDVVNVEYWIVSNETNTDVCMYTLRIYSYVVESVVCGSTCCKVDTQCRMRMMI